MIQKFVGNQLCSKKCLVKCDEIFPTVETKFNQLKINCDLMKTLNLKKHVNQKVSHCSSQKETKNHIVGWILMNMTYNKKEEHEEEEKEKEVVLWHY